MRTEKKEKNTIDDTTNTWDRRTGIKNHARVLSGGCDRLIRLNTHADDEVPPSPHLNAETVYEVYTIAVGRSTRETPVHRWT